MDDTLAEAHTSLAYIKWLHDRDWSGAEKEFVRAIDLNPNYATARHWHGRYLASLGRFDEAMEEMKRAQEIDPLSLSISTSLGSVSYFSRQYDQAIAAFQKTLEMEPNFHAAHWYLAYVYERKQMYQEAIAEYQKGLSLLGSEALAKALGRGNRKAGYRGAIRTLLDSWKEQSEHGVAPAFSMAKIYATLEDKDQAFEWLEKAYQAHHPWLIHLKVDPQFDSLRSDARFQDLLKRVGFEP